MTTHMLFVKEILHGHTQLWKIGLALSTWHKIPEFSTDITEVLITTYTISVWWEEIQSMSSAAVSMNLYDCRGKFYSIQVNEMGIIVNDPVWHIQKWEGVHWAVRMCVRCVNDWLWHRMGDSNSWPCKSTGFLPAWHGFHENLLSHCRFCRYTRISWELFYGFIAMQNSSK